MNQRTKSKSPFILLEDIVSLEDCEEILLSTKHNEPNKDAKLKSLKTVKQNPLWENRLAGTIDNILEKIAEPHYGFETIDIKPYQFEWYPEGYKASQPTSDNSVYKNGTWAQIHDFHFTIILFLTTSKTEELDDSFMQSFGGNLEFVNHQLTITPKAGTIVMFPSNNYFLNTVSSVALGNMNCIRIHVTAKDQFVYNPKDYPGDQRTWFA